MKTIVDLKSLSHLLPEVQHLSDLIVEPLEMENLKIDIEKYF